MCPTPSTSLPSWWELAGVTLLVAGNRFGVALHVRTLGEARSAGAFRMDTGVDSRMDTWMDGRSAGGVCRRGWLHHGYQRDYQKDQHRN